MDGIELLKDFYQQSFSEPFKIKTARHNTEFKNYTDFFSFFLHGQEELHSTAMGEDSFPLNCICMKRSRGSNFNGLQNEAFCGLVLSV